jgi:hypothetical protein
VFWWSKLPHKLRMFEKNLFGHGVPGRNNSLHMDVQFNLPVSVFSRRSGGAFLRHLPTNKIILAHRGIVTLGHGRIQKRFLFARMNGRVREANTSTRTREFLRIGELKSATLVNDISKFCTQVRSVVQAARVKHAKRKKPRVKATRQSPLTKLREYFEEFAGQYQIKGRRKTVADSYHGKIVEALQNLFRETLKSGAVDLVGIKCKKAFLFEVKKSHRPQSIYTAVGQLAIHTPTVTRYFPGKTVRKVVVLSRQPSKHLLDILTRKLKIIVLTFARSKTGKIAIEGVDKLK